eukprot:CAMPEP_0181186202 /NCGR_PEP_ID=MMETSP1096-20121128/9911_1 /TAXON_ID=156174 ORGANISM="Chrysochromulina ericina, Strain CCMP281" /NCGR_SAMPLE_ID=MMETSP1096 /ASSEMBLY_ACC=CAM_ASM_000453 /LENGTH=151 /DNA_ID=CAMNT_0023275089 /DNA_START=222 /DNA_END=678 /DNA_ORIENTATION=-
MDQHATDKGTDTPHTSSKVVSRGETQRAIALHHALAGDDPSVSTHSAHVHRKAAVLSTCAFFLSFRLTLLLENKGTICSVPMTSRRFPPSSPPEIPPAIAIGAGSTSPSFRTGRALGASPPYRPSFGRYEFLGRLSGCKNPVAASASFAAI